MQSVESKNLPKSQTAIAPTPKVAAVAGAITSAAAVALLSGDLAWSAFGAAIISAVLCAVVADVIKRLVRKRLSVRWISLICLIIAIAFVQSLAFRASLIRSAFVDAFGSSPPGMVRNLRVARYYAGGPGDTITLMSFQADPAGLQKLIDALPPSDDDMLVIAARAGEPAQVLWERGFQMANRFAGSWWPRSPNMAQPMVYVRHGIQMQTPPTSTTIIWDRATGQAYIMTTVG